MGWNSVVRPRGEMELFHDTFIVRILNIKQNRKDNRGYLAEYNEKTLRETL